MAGSFFIYFIVTALASSAAILLILLVKKIVKMHISMRWQYNLDLLFLILLAVPFIPSGLLGVFNTGNWLNALRFGGNTVANTGTAAGEGTAVMYGTGW